MSASTPIRTAIVGFGGSGSRIHARLLESLDDYEITAIVTAHATELAQQRHPHAAVISDIAELPEVDLAVVAAPDEQHVELGSRLLERGIPTVIEKPLAPTSAGVMQLQSIAKANGVPVIAFQNRRWDADFRTALDVVRSGRLGDIIRFDSWLHRWSPGPWENWRQEPRPGTVDGPVADLGSHMVDQAIFAFGHVRTVTAELDTRRSFSKVADDGFASLLHHSGVRSHLRFGFMTSSPTPTYVVQGTQAAVQTDGVDGQMTASSHDVGPLDSEWRSYDTWSAQIWDGSDDPIATERSESDARGFYEALARTLREGATPPVDPEDTLHLVRVLEAIIASAESNGTPIEVSQPR